MTSPFSFLMVALAFSAIPGPAFLTVLFTAIRHGVRSAKGVILGILVVDALYSASALGAAAVCAAFPWIFIVTRLLGGGYLGWLGVHGLRALVAVSGELELSKPISAALQMRAAVHLGLAVQLTNVKLFLFLVSIVPTYVVPDASAATQLALICATFLVTEATVYYTVATCAIWIRPWLITARAQILIKYAGAFLMLVLGIL